MKADLGGLDQGQLELWPYFGDGELATLPQAVKERLQAAVLQTELGELL